MNFHEVNHWRLMRCRELSVSNWPLPKLSHLALLLNMACHSLLETGSCEIHRWAVITRWASLSEARGIVESFAGPGVFVHIQERRWLAVSGPQVICCFLSSEFTNQVKAQVESCCQINRPIIILSFFMLSMVVLSLSWPEGGASGCLAAQERKSSGWGGGGRHLLGIGLGPLPSSCRWAAWSSRVLLTLRRHWSSLLWFSLKPTPCWGP